jgi:hypothetical protein
MTTVIKDLFLTEEMSPEQLQKVHGGFIRIGPAHWSIPDLGNPKFDVGTYPPGTRTDDAR